MWNFKRSLSGVWSARNRSGWNSKFDPHNSESFKVALILLSLTFSVESETQVQERELSQSRVLWKMCIHPNIVHHGVYFGVRGSDHQLSPWDFYTMLLPFLYC